MLCRGTRETYLHIWVECSRIRSFWKQIFHIYNEIYDESLTPSPKIKLLSSLRGPTKAQKSCLLRFFLSAARQSISRFWKSNTSPPLNLWVDLNYFMLMEEKQVRELDAWEKHNKLWYPWLHYSTSDKLRGKLST